MFSENKISTKQIIVVTVIIISLLLLLVVLVKATEREPIDITVEIPSNWDSDYIESSEDYEALVEFNDINWETFEAVDGIEDAIYATVDDTVTITFSTAPPRVAHQTESDSTIIMLPEDSAWELISNGIYTTYPTGSFNSNKSKLEKIKQNSTEVITVNVWYWEDPEDPNNFNKVTKQKKFAVNSNIASLFIHCFEDIYNHPDKPVINLADKGMGTWVLRGKNHNGNASLSAHSLGCSIDINPSTGNARVNGKWYGNGYGMNVMSEQMWSQLPDTHTKYHILYDGCPIVETFKSYGFVWGGDWSGTKDPMHLSFIGEGKTCREKGKQNYLERR